MADPLYMEVTVSTPFKSGFVVYLPGRTYHVTPDIYASTLDDGTKFADHCITATETYSYP